MFELDVVKKDNESLLVAKLTGSFLPDHFSNFCYFEENKAGTERFSKMSYRGENVGPHLSPWF